MNSNNKRLRKYLEDLFTTGSEGYPRIIQKTVMLLPDIKVDNGNNGDSNGKPNNNSQSELVAIISFNLADERDSDSDLSYNNNSIKEYRSYSNSSISTGEKSTEISTSNQDDVVNIATIISNDNGSNTHYAIDDEVEESVESVGNVTVANAHVDVDLGLDAIVLKPLLKTMGLKSRSVKIFSMKTKLWQ